MRRIRSLLLAALGLLAAGLAHAAPPSVILISLDGTTPEQVDRALPTAAALGRRGARADALVPVWPSNTFPNHVTLATGVAPERHGIVNNVFIDPERGLHRYENDPSWTQVEPIWSLAARAGVVSASFHWVASEGPWTSGLGPRHWEPFDAGTPEREKVDQILAWLDLEDPGKRPRLVTSWFHGADRAGHRYGPDAAETRASLASQEAALARLVAGLEAREQMESTTLILVSDHGMATVHESVDLAAALEDAGVDGRVLGGGGMASVWLDARADADAAVAVARDLGLEAWARAEAPAAWRTGNPRFGDVVVRAAPPVAIARGGTLGFVQRLLRGFGLRSGGAHGYDPELDAMAGIFLAWGRGVPAGTRIPRVEAVDVAPTVLTLLGVEVPAWMEGRPRLPTRADAAAGADAAQEVR